MLAQYWILLFWSATVSTPTVDTSIYSEVFQSSSAAVYQAAGMESHCRILHDGKEYRVVKKVTEAHLEPDIDRPFESGDCVQEKEFPFEKDTVEGVSHRSNPPILFTLQDHGIEAISSWEHCK